MTSPPFSLLWTGKCSHEGTLLSLIWWLDEVTELIHKEMENAPQTRKLEESDQLQYKDGAEAWETPETGRRDCYEKSWEE